MSEAPRLKTKYNEEILAALDRLQAGGSTNGGDGIVVKGVENTIRNIGTLASEGMRETDRTIIRMMIQEH